MQNSNRGIAQNYCKMLEWDIRFLPLDEIPSIVWTRGISSIRKINLDTPLLKLYNWLNFLRVYFLMQLTPSAAVRGS